MKTRTAFMSRWDSFLCATMLSASVQVHAGECWVDLYDQPNFSGTLAHIEGPVEMPSLKSVSGEVWSNRIESLKVGPAARLIAFKAENFDISHTGPVAHPDAFESWGQSEIPAYHDLEISFGPGKKESHLADLHFHKSINALKIFCP